MKSTFRKMLVGMIGASFMIGAMAPVSAASLMPAAPVAVNENVQHVRDDRWRGRGDHRWNRHRHGPRPGWNGRPYRGDRGYWNGHRGYRDYRRGYRRHNDGWWYPLAAFGAGAIIGGAIASPPAAPVYRAPAYNNG